MRSEPRCHLNSFAVLGLKAGYPVGKFNFLLDASNLTDEVYSGSVQVETDS